MSTEISVEQLTNIICQISEQHSIDKNELLSFIPGNNSVKTNDQKPTNKKIETNLCFALVSDGTRCTKKSKNKISCLCGIHENALEKNGKLPYGRFDTNNQTNDSTTTSATQNTTNSELKAKSKKNGKSKNDKIKVETYLEDSDNQDSDVETSKSKISPTDILKSQIDEAVIKIVNKQNFSDETKLKKLIKDHIFKNEIINSNFKKINKIVVESIQNSLKKRIGFFENEAKKEFNKVDINSDNELSQQESDSDSEPEIECTKIIYKGKDYLMDENTNIVYHIETHEELGRFNNGLVVFD